MSAAELGRIEVPALFIWGSDDAYLRPDQGRCALAHMPAAVLHEVPGGHGPWLEDPYGCARLVAGHFATPGPSPAP